MVHNYDISFWETDLCREISYDPNIDLLPDFFDDDDFDSEDLDDDFNVIDDMEQTKNNRDDKPDDRIPTWSVEIEYIDETEQNTKGYNYLPDPVMELFDHFNSFFEDELLDDKFNKYDESIIEPSK